jgi:hypothetical protein
MAMGEPRRRHIYSGLALIVLGLTLYAVQGMEGLGRSALFFLVGGAFLAAYFYRKDFDLLIPAGLICGIGAGMLDSVPMLAGIGGGFVAITIVALIYERRFEGWLLIPGAVLLLVGLREMQILEYFIKHWPLLVVVAGVLILLGAFGRRAPRAD